MENEEDIQKTADAPKKVLKHIKDTMALADAMNVSKLGYKLRVCMWYSALLGAMAQNGVYGVDETTWDEKKFAAAIKDIANGDTTVINTASQLLQSERGTTQNVAEVRQRNFASMVDLFRFIAEQIEPLSFGSSDR